jgi:hypothetical protein
MEKSGLVEFVGTVTIPANNKKFVARDHFIVDITKMAKVKISSLNENFETSLLGKIEEPKAETILNYSFMIDVSLEQTINKLGGRKKSETMLVDMFSLMEKQANGQEEGKLLTNGYSNIFFIRDITGLFLWAVRLNWYNGGWCIRADDVSFRRRGIDSGLVFSRNSLKL